MIAFDDLDLPESRALEIWVDERGEVTRVSVVEPVGHGFDEAALIAALQEERIAGAGLDVYEFEPKVPEWENG